MGKRVLLRAALAALLGLAAPGAWSACADMAGGIGGTGAVAKGGVGGTGAPATLGVVGTITEFASVCVNGLEIHYDAATPVTVNGRPAAASQLALGQVVAVEAAPAAGRLAARSITILRVVEGPVTRVDPDTQTVFVMGQGVRLTDETATPLRGSRLATLEAGTAVQVSGYRDARGDIVASRLDIAPLQVEHSVIGRLAQGDARVGDLPVSLAGRPSPGRDVLVRGRWDGERLRASSVVEDPSKRLLVRVDRAVVESLVREARRGNSLRVGEFQVRIGRDTRIEGALQADQRVRVFGVPERDGIAAERIEVRGGQGRPGRGGAERAPRTGDGDRGRDSSGPGRPESVERDNSGPGRGESVERAERPEKSGSGRVERPERVDRSGSNSGRQ